MASLEETKVWLKFANDPTYLSQETYDAMYASCDTIGAKKIYKLYELENLLKSPLHNQSASFKICPLTSDFLPPLLLPTSDLLLPTSYFSLPSPKNLKDG